MIILGDKKYIEAEFENEQEIEDVVIQNAEYFFGPSSIFLPKKLIRTKGGFGTIPDGFAIDLALRNWYVVEVELNHHSVWSHIAPQIAKQIIAVSTPDTRQVLEEIMVQMFNESEEVKEKFRDEKIREIDVRKVIGEILKKPPVIGMPIDKITLDLKEWAETLKNDIRLWVVKKYVDFNVPENIAYEIPEEYRPDLDITDEKKVTQSGMAFYDVSLTDLINSGLINVGDELIMNYKPRGGSQKKYKAVVNEDGSMTILDKKFKSPSYAALLGMQEAGSERKSVNGWTSWKDRNGKYLADLRTEYLTQENNERTSF